MQFKTPYSCNLLKLFPNSYISRSPCYFKIETYRLKHAHEKTPKVKLSLCLTKYRALKTKPFLN